MADILSMVLDVASIIDGCKKYYRSVRDASKTMYSIMDQVTSLGLQLELLDEILKQDNGRVHHLRTMLYDKNILPQVRYCLQELKKLVVTESGVSDQHHSPTRPRLAEAYKRLTWPLTKESKAEELLVRLERHKSTISLILNTQAIIDIQDTGDKIDEQAKDKDKRRILAWLKPGKLDSHEIHLEKTDLREQETCDWMTNSDIWKAWTDGGSLSENGYRRFVWIHGIPGSGKTILASFLIDKIGDFCQANGRSYYYCSHQREQDETRSFLQWIIADFCNQASRYIPMDLLNLYKHHRDNIYSVSIDDLMKCLLTITKHFGRRVYIIVDAVDESKTPRNHFLKVLTTIGTDPQFHHVSLLMVSRDEQDIRAAIQGLPPLNNTTSFLRKGLALTPLPGSGHNSPVEMRRPGLMQSPRQPPPSPSPRPSTPTGNSRKLPSPSQNIRICPYMGMPTGFPPPVSPIVPSEDCNPGDVLRTPTKCPDQNDQRPKASMRPPRHGVLLPENLRPRQPYTELSMDNQFVLRAIQTYVQRRVGRIEGLRDLRPEFLRELESKLARESRGMFRWAACQIDTIVQLELIDEYSIQKLLGNLPKTVFGIYEQLLVERLPYIGHYTNNNRTFARTALALICSNSSEIPSADVLVEASLFNVPRGRTHAYNTLQLEKILGCLIKVTPLTKRPPWVFKHDNEEAGGARRRVAPAHYTVKEYLFHPDTALGPAKDFALSQHTTRVLELEVAFNGLLQLGNLGPRQCPTRYEEYCLRMTDKALQSRRPLIVQERSIWEAVLPCLNPNSAHQDALRTQQIRQAFPRWARLNGIFRTDRGAVPPARHETAILISLLLLRWPELAAIQLQELPPEDLGAVWNDSFIITPAMDGRNANAGGVLMRQTISELCVSRRHIDFLEHLIKAGADFEDENHILYAALQDPYVQNDYVADNDKRTMARQDDGTTTSTLLKMVLQQGANPNPEGYKYTPLQAAIRHLEERWVQSLLLEQADPNAIGDPEGKHPYGEGQDEPWFQHHPLRICREADPPWDDDDFEFEEQAARARARVEALLVQYGAREPDEDDDMEEDQGHETIVLDN